MAEKNAVQRLLTSPYFMLALQTLAFSQVWPWYGARLTDGSDEPWGLLSLLTGLVLVLMDSAKATHQRRSMLVPALLTLLYAAAYPLVPRLIQAAIAVMAIGNTLSVVRCGRPLHPPIAGLCLLSVPLISSLQFYCGYPLRVASGAVATVLLNVSGLGVYQEAACLRWAGDLIAIDAPCSGVRMLWAGLYLAFTVTAVCGLTPMARMFPDRGALEKGGLPPHALSQHPIEDASAHDRGMAGWGNQGESMVTDQSSFGEPGGWMRTLLIAAGAVVTVILGNGIRSASLFQLETGLVNMPTWSHDAVGIMVFAFVGIAIACMAHALSGGGRCVTYRSF